MKHFVFFWVVLLSSTFSIWAQTWPADTIQSQINTGNPQFPFPQFQEYTAGKTLAAHNAEGVTHADMEKAMREGYKIMMHRCLYVPGKELNGIPYIIYNHSSVPFNNNTFVSEGDGYALLAAAYFADKEAFDGLWLWIHDNRMSKVKKYYDCLDLRPEYPHGPYLACWQCDETTDAGQTSVNSATDGDYDIAMALLIAAAQWPSGMGISDACGNPISYREEALNVMKALVDTVYYTQAASGAEAGGKGYLTGDIGIDGYCKNGNTWAEITDWRYSAANLAYAWASTKPDPLQVKDLYTDYIGPAYFNEFARYLTTNGGTPWQINQFKRGEASSDWLIGQLYDKGYIASSGSCTVSDDGSITTFGQHPSGPGGEDFRASWRTILNYVWHGNPETTWNPATHELEPVGNSFEKDMGLRHADFLKYPRELPSDNTAAHCQKMGASPDPSSPTWKGVANIKQAHLVTGAEGSDNYRTNYNVGTGAAAAVASEDLELIGEIYRQSEILWDDVNTAMPKTAPDEERYIKSTPKYFHDWFRLLGMLTASGNLHPFGNMEPTANLKVYLSVDKTYAYAGDLVTYTVSYRNYGSVDASAVSISTPLGTDYEFVSATEGGTFGGGSITWNIGSVPGFKTSTGIAPTQGTRQFTVRVKNPEAAAKACLTSTIKSGNAPEWVSNEYPNNTSYTMERNCVDLLPARSLNIIKTTDRKTMNPGDIVNFKLQFENKSSPDLWLDGGRDKVVVSYGNYYLASNTFYQFYRFWHSAPEAYVNMHNYRVSYFMNDPAAIGLYDATTNPTGWAFSVDNQNDLDKYFYNPSTLPEEQRITFTHQPIPWGSNEGGSWNQRIMIRFANVLTAPTTHIYDKLDNMYLIHKGVIGPGFIRTKMESTPPSSLASRLADDWSYSNLVDIGKVDGQDKTLSPVSNSWANPLQPDLPVNNYSKDVCDPDVPHFKKLLVEEFDGYTWRRIAGDGPLPGREAYNVEVVDTIPKEFTWGGFTDEEALGITASYFAAPDGAAYSGIVRWVIPVMQVGTEGDLTYKVIASDLPACPAPDRNFVNTGYIFSQTDSPDTSVVKLKITCNAVPPTQPEETSLHKKADKTNAEVGDIVTYSIEFENKDGSIAQWDPASPGDWQTMGIGTTMPEMNQTVIELDQNNNSTKPGPNGYSFSHVKSHGTNGYIEVTVDPSNSSPFSLIFRHSGGTPGQTDFKGLALQITPNPGGPNTIDFEVTDNGTTLPPLMGISYGGSADPIKIRAELINDQLFIWMNNFTGAPLKVISNITAGLPGFAGLFTSGAQQKITAWKTHFDSSFDLEIKDTLPEALIEINDISDDGVLSNGVISWPKEEGPILGGEKVVRTFKAKVGSCNDFIANTANAAVYGITGITSQYIIHCGASNCTAPVITSADTGSVCSGIPQNYTITSDIESATYNWSRASVDGITNEPVSDQTASTIKEVLNNISNEPIVVRYTIIATDNTCSGVPFNFDVTVHPGGQAETVDIGNICSGVAQAFDITSEIGPGSYSWSREEVSGISNPAVMGDRTTIITEALINTTSVPLAVKYIIRSQSTGCGNTYNYEVNVNPAPLITSADSLSICTGTEFSYDIMSNIPAPSITWRREVVSGISNPATSDQNADPILETLHLTGENTAMATYIITPSGSDCPGIPFVLQVTVHEKPVITSPATDTLCSGESMNYKITANTDNATFLWSRAAVDGVSNPGLSDQKSDPITERLEITGTESVNVRYVLMPYSGGCMGETFNLDVDVYPSTTISSHPLSADLCEGAPLSLESMATGTNISYQWKFNDVPIPGAISSTYYLPETTVENTGVYSVEVKSSCTSITSNAAEVVVNTYPLDTLSVNGGKTCSGKDGTVTVINSQKGVRYEAFAGSTSVSAVIGGNGEDLEIKIVGSQLQEGINTIAIHANGCSSVILLKTAVVSVTPMPIANAGSDIVLEELKEVTLDGSQSTQGAYTYQWTSSDPGVRIESPGRIITVAEPKSLSTDFTLLMTDIDNPLCSSSDMVNVKITQGLITVPDAFSPNGDGIHDQFEIPGIKSYPQAILEVYNQWGELIYKSSPGYSEWWDGTRNGKPVPVSAYYYILKLNDMQLTEFAGSITIIK